MPLLVHVAFRQGTSFQGGDGTKKAISLACVGMIFWVLILSLVFLEVRGMNKATMGLEVRNLRDRVWEENGPIAGQKGLQALSFNGGA